MGLFAQAPHTNKPLLNFLKQFKEGKGEGIKKFTPPPFLTAYLKLVYSKEKQPQASASNQDTFILQLIESAYYPEKFEKKWRDQIKNEKEKAFFFLSLAKNTVFFHEENFALKFFFQSFLLFSSWKDKYPLADKIVFINEWFYHFNESYASFKEKINQDSYEYYTSLMISCFDLLYNIPYYYLIHPKTEITFANHFIKTHSEKLLQIDDQYKIFAQDKFKFPAMKLFLISTVLFMSERNYLKADSFSNKLYQFFNSQPITEDLFIIYEETLKNKILLNLKLSRMDESLQFLNKYLSYSQACNKLKENWNEMKDILSGEDKGSEFIKNPRVQKILSGFKLSRAAKKITHSKGTT